MAALLMLLGALALVASAALYDLRLGGLALGAVLLAAGWDLSIPNPVEPE